MEHLRTVTREFQTGDPAVLHLEARSGSVTVEGRETGAIRVEAIVRVWSDLASDADDAAASVERAMEQDGHRVIVRAPALPQSGTWNILSLGRRGPSVDFRVLVPLHTAVRVLSLSGPVSISHIDARVETDMRSGRCKIDGVTGDVKIVGRSGSIEATRISGDVEIESRSGRVRASEVGGDVHIDAKSGSIDLAKIGGDVRISNRSGSTNIDTAGKSVHVRSRCGPFRYRGAVGGDFDIDVTTGPITLAVNPDQPFFIDAESHTGPVRSDLPPRSGGSGPAAGGPKVRLRTHTGPIRLTRAD